MPNKTKSGKSSDQANIKNIEPDLPHERDETTEDHASAPRKKMKQALIDLENGQKDTDLHGQRGVESVVSNPVNPKKADTSSQ